MTCGSCGAGIADKAIVCYRCGAPTAAATPPPPTAGGRLWALPAILLVLAATLAAATLGMGAASTARLPTAAAAVGLALVGIAAWARALRARRR